MLQKEEISLTIMMFYIAALNRKFFRGCSGMKVSIDGMKVNIFVELSREEALNLLEEVKDIKVGTRPLLHELLDRVAETLGKEL
jgi:hypothetical protein